MDRATTELIDGSDVTGMDPVADAAETSLEDDTIAETETAAMSPATRAAYGALLELEDRQAEMRRRATAEAEAATASRPELQAAEAALERAEAAEIVSPSDETAAAVAGARARVDDLTDAKAKHTRASNVLEAEAEQLDAELDGLRGEVYDAAFADLESLRGRAADEFEARLADLVPQLRREAAVTDVIARLAGGLASASGRACRDEIERVERALELAGELKTSWRDNAVTDVESLRSVAAYAAPNPGAIQPEWIDEDKRDRFFDRRRVEAQRRELKRKEAIASAQRAQTDYINSGPERARARRDAAREARRAEERHDGPAAA